MTTALIHIVEPQALLLVWQGNDESDRQSRTRRIVGKITREQGAAAKLEYLKQTPDFTAALEHGFTGYPGFSLTQTSHVSETVLEAMMRRLPPRKREDFADYLALHRLPNPFPFSDFALLGYTEARLPSDGFSIVPIFNPEETPCEYVLEVAGVRHNCVNTEQLAKGDEVKLFKELDNPVEPGAIAVLHNDQRIGYVNRAFMHTVAAWLESKKIRAIIERKNGKPDRPLIYIRLLIN